MRRGPISPPCEKKVSVWVRVPVDGRDNVCRRGSEATDVNRRLVIIHRTRVAIVWVVRHDAVELRVSDRRDGCHDNGRDRGEVPPLYLASRRLIKSWATLKLGCFALAGRCCYRSSHDSPKKVII